MRSESDKIKRMYPPSSEDEELEKQELIEAGIETAPQTTIQTNSEKQEQNDEGAATNNQTKVRLNKVLVGIIIFFTVIGLLGAISKAVG